METGREHSHDEDVDDHGDTEAAATLDGVVQNRLLLRAGVWEVDLARLNERWVQEDVVRHDERSDDAWRDAQLRNPVYPVICL